MVVFTHKKHRTNATLIKEQSMHLPRRRLLKLSTLTLLPGVIPWAFPRVTAAEPLAQSLFLGQGYMAGEVTATSVLLQTRLTSALELSADGDLPGKSGFVAFEWSTASDFSAVKRSVSHEAIAERDFIVRAMIDDLQPNTLYYYRALFGVAQDHLVPGPRCSFRTLVGQDSDRPINFMVGSCMNYNKFMYGKKGKASGPLTATEEDKRLGFPVFPSMAALKPDFFVGTGDIVYYDNPLRVSETVPQLRRCWHEQFRFPRLIDFFAQVPCYWSKDDHDFRYNESDNTTARLPLPQTGIATFHEQLPITPINSDQPMYRTHRVSKRVHIWLTEGRDHRSPNDEIDGPHKSLWGAQQKKWLQETLLASDATWKIIISPTPMVGPDDATKSDNHVGSGGFQHEGKEFFAWLQQHKIKNVIIICGDRHWQYHSIHPSGIEEFACGALNDENARMGVAPGNAKGTDPNGLIKQPFISPTPQGGFLRVMADEHLTITHYNARGEVLNQVTRKA
jgi:alkaline phosphatase D